MTFSKKITAALLSAAMLLSITACGGSTPAAGDTTTAAPAGDTATTTAATTAANDETAATEGTSADGFALSDNVGTLKWLGYFDLNIDQPIYSAIFEDKYKGTIESELCSSGDAYFERLGVLVTSGTSPDLVTYEWRAYPHGISQNLYTPLDDYIDLSSDLWKDMKSTADQFLYGGKHYYIPHEMRTNFALNYNKKALEAEGLNDPMELYQNGEWDWNAFESLLTEWCNLGEDYIGYTGVGAMSFIETTGTKLIEITPDGQILNNTKNANVQRCMEWLEKLSKNGFLGTGYVSPQEGFLDGKTLFVGLEPFWCYEASKEALKKAAVEEEMAFIPFPKDPSSDAYYQGYDTYGYMVPAGASNIQAAIAFLTVCRTYVTDPENVANDKAEKTDTSPSYFPKCPECKYSFIENDCDDLDTCPECGAARKAKFKAVYTDEQYDILYEMKNPTGKFTFLFDNVNGFSDTFDKLFNGGSEDAPSLLDGPLYHGASYTALRESLEGTIESYLEPYRAKLLEANSAQ